MKLDDVDGGTWLALAFLAFMVALLGLVLYCTPPRTVLTFPATPAAIQQAALARDANTIVLELRDGVVVDVRTACR